MRATKLPDMPTAPLRILVVEDQPLLLARISQLLQAEGHRVLEATSFHQAWRLFDEQRPDMLLLDILLPDHSGLELARRIRAGARGPWTPVIFLSSLDSEDDLAAAIEAGGDDYLVQPVSPLVLKAKVHAMQRLLEARRELTATTAALQEANEQLSRQIMHDQLTGLGNRKGLDDRLARYIGDARREQRPLSLILCDVDFFKRYNDRLGHLEGDQCLQQIARILKQVCRRPLDYAARYGGEEFVLLLPHTPPEGALSFALALLHHMERDSLYHPDSTVAGHVTLSGGMLSGIPGHDDDGAHWLQHADEALYAAKQRGRGRFVSLQHGHDTGDIIARRHPGVSTSGRAA